MANHDEQSLPVILTVSCVRVHPCLVGARGVEGPVQAPQSILQQIVCRNSYTAIKEASSKMLRRVGYPLHHHTQGWCKRFPLARRSANVRARAPNLYTPHASSSSLSHVHMCGRQRHTNSAAAAASPPSSSSSSSPLAGSVTIPEPPPIDAWWYGAAGVYLFAMIGAVYFWEWRASESRPLTNRPERIFKTKYACR